MGGYLTTGKKKKRECVCVCVRVWICHVGFEKQPPPPPPFCGTWHTDIKGGGRKRQTDKPNQNKTEQNE